MQSFILIALYLSSCTTSSQVLAWSHSGVCGRNFTGSYEPVSGKCWTLPSDILPNASQLINKILAQDKCSRVSGSLPSPATIEDLLGMQRYLTSKGLAADVWTASIRENSTGFYYQDSGKPVPSSLWLNDTSSTIDSTFNCAVYTSWVSSTKLNGQWQRTMGLRPVNCSSLHAAVCFKNVTQCQLTDLPDSVNLVTMTAVNSSFGATLTNLFHIGIRLDVQCKLGYYRPRDSPYTWVAAPSPTSDGLTVNQIECFPGAEANVSPTLKSATIEACQITSCPTEHLKTTTIIPNVEPYVESLTKDYYLYDEAFPVNCTPGYVSYSNTSSVKSLLRCGFNTMDHTKYEWVPPDLNACQPVACPLIQSVIPSYTTAFKAINRIHEKEFNEFQQSSYPYFPNRVYIKCAQTGHFFEDRTFTKVISCELNNGSLTEGGWFGALGTSLSRLRSMACVPVSCLSDQLIEKSTAGDRFLSSLRYTNSTNIELANGSQISVATDSVNSVEFYTYGTVIRFQCQTGSSTGIGQPVVMCTNTGNWNVSMLPTCTKTSEAVIAKGRHYVPPRVEAQGADSVGAIAIIVCVIFGVFIVILDLSTLSRDLNLIRRNIRRLKSRMTKTDEAAHADLESMKPSKSAV